MMVEPIYVTEVKERKSDWPWRKIWVYNKYSDGTIYNPWDDFPEIFNLNAHHSKKKEADDLSHKLYELGPNPDIKKARRIVNKLLKICETPYEKKTTLEKWSNTAVQMPGDIGGPRKEDIKKLITSKSEGNVLETMCGFNSYFLEDEKISEVIALDFCKEMLERYAFPNRKRILFDLERISHGEKLDFFKRGNFQTIGCWGSNYLGDPVSVFREFNRILSKGGKFLILESTTEGYPDQIKRYFDPRECSSFMQSVGFSTNIEHLAWLKTEFEIGEYYLVEGVK